MNDVEVKRRSPEDAAREFIRRARETPLRFTDEELAMMLAGLIESFVGHAVAEERKAIAREAVLEAARPPEVPALRWFAGQILARGE